MPTFDNDDTWMYRIRDSKRVVGMMAGATDSMIVSTVTAQARRHATRLVASNATDAEDAALLLDMLGLEPGEGK